ncbi:winged helix-turn-helix domain-containing protein [Micromonospora sp. NPDC047620]|uniref:winged helix-turn-helix domain-containing protein n=1 Tax=Micromonospora sp. NPDC047620 TaxID=3364251 RepID=UPI0037192619
MAAGQQMVRPFMVVDQSMVGRSACCLPAEDVSPAAGSALSAISRCRQGRRPRTSTGRRPLSIPVLDVPLCYAGLELQTSTGLVRLHAESSAVMLSGQQVAVLAVLITARGTPLSREAIWAAMPRGYRPPTAAQIGVVIAHIRKKIGAARILTGADGWWVRDPIVPEPVDGTDVLSFGSLRLDVEHRYVLDGPARFIRLGPQEFAVLRVLVEARGVPRSRSGIWSSLPPHDRPATIAAVGVLIHHLRERLGPDRIITGGGGWWLAGPAKPRPRAAEWAGVRLERTTSET